jgi:hypothetical protein
VPSSFVNHAGNLARLALALLLASGGCAALRHSQPEDETDVVTVMIVNNHALNVTVFNVAHGRRERLGEVTAIATGSFKVHLQRLPANELQLHADPIGSTRPVTSELLHVSPGDLVQWTLESNLTRSHIMIR